MKHAPNKLSARKLTYVLVLGVILLPELPHRLDVYAL